MTDYASIIFDDLIKERAQLNQQLLIYKGAIIAIRDLINESVGVVGIHVNGDIALWDDLLSGGYQQAWLCDVSKAIDLASKTIQKTKEVADD